MFRKPEISDLKDECDTAFLLINSSNRIAKLTIHDVHKSQVRDEPAGILSIFESECNKTLEILHGMGFGLQVAADPNLDCHSRVEKSNPRDFR